MAYRGEASDVARVAPKNDVLDEIVHQFADSYAFVRELVQNALDAGTTQIHLRVEEHRGGFSTAVEDDGSGMTLEIIEGPLLTAFASGKEGGAASGKIGKYGVGFLSVFALKPSRVIVSTSTHDAAYDVVILADRSFTIEARAPHRRGTTVTMVWPGAVDGARLEHATRVENAARHWCRHVRTPLLFSVDGGPSRRLDEPFGLDAHVSVVGEREGVRAVVGIRGGGAPAAFYHAGLLLHETSDCPPAIPHVSFKLESSRFQHTISRDGVRADRAYAEGLDLAKDLAEGALVEALRPAIAEDIALDATTEAQFTRSALLVAAASRLLKRRHVELPLAVPTADGARSIRFARLAETRARNVYTAGSRSFVAELLAADGATVLRDDAVGTVRAYVGGARRAEDVAALLRSSDADPLLDLVGDALRAAGVHVRAVAFGDEHGGIGERATWFVAAERRTSTGLGGWLAVDTRVGVEVVLVRAAPAIRFACAAADARSAAALVARLVLAEARMSTDQASSALLAWAAGAGEP